MGHLGFLHPVTGTTGHSSACTIWAQLSLFIMKYVRESYVLLSTAKLSKYSFILNKNFIIIAPQYNILSFEHELISANFWLPPKVILPV
jgi:hypothetical protein